MTGNSTMTDDELEGMPWTSDLMTIQDFEKWVASRAEAGQAIDVQTCEIGQWYAYGDDPYGLRDRKGELDNEFKAGCEYYYVRSSDSRGWICEDALPDDKGQALYDRIKRDGEAYPVLKERLEHAVETLKLRNEPDSDAHYQSESRARRMILGALFEFAARRDALDVRTVSYLVEDAIEAAIKSGRACGAALGPAS